MNKRGFSDALILKENKACISKSHPVLTFSDIEVEKRPLSVYEEYSGGIRYE